MTSLAIGVGAYAFARWTDQALADSLGLRTLRFGTDPRTWVKIHLVGAHFKDDKTNLLRDGAMVVANSTDDYGIDLSRVFDYLDQWVDQVNRPIPKLLLKPVIMIYKWVLQNHFSKMVLSAIQQSTPRLYSFLFSWSPPMIIFRKCVQQAIPATQKFLATYFTGQGNCCWPGRMAVGLLATATVPTIKFRFREQQANAYFADKIGGRVLLNTDESFSPFDSGLLGTLKNGLRIGLPILHQPVRVLSGLSSLALAGAAAYGTHRYFPGFIPTHRTALLVGAFFAVI